MKIDGLHGPAEIPDQSTAKPKTGEAGGFGDTLADAIEKVAEAQKQAEAAVQGLAEGTEADIHTAMLAMQKADVSFQMMMQVRNKLISAYEEVMRMQV